MASFKKKSDLNRGLCLYLPVRLIEAIRKVAEQEERTLNFVAARALKKEFLQEGKTA